MKQNCWEFKRCGRQPQGLKTHELGVCPASVEERLDGIHEGTNAGRTCWVVAGTYCKGEIQGTYSKKTSSCMACDFYKKLKDEEGEGLIGSFTLLTKLV